MIHTVKDFGIVNKAEVDVFLDLSCFLDDPADVGNLISGSILILGSLNLNKIRITGKLCNHLFYIFICLCTLCSIPLIIN